VLFGSSDGSQQPGERFQPNVDANTIAIVWQPRWLVFDREACVPASCFTANGQRFDRTDNRAVLLDLDIADFR
jgi:hypothetical protein